VHFHYSRIEATFKKIPVFYEGIIQDKNDYPTLRIEKGAKIAKNEAKIEKKYSTKIDKVP